jgi:hypothetical protein
MQIAHEQSVFINCPFDSSYTSLLDAIIFATVCCGFIPRSAREPGAAAAELRIERILRLLFESRHSIHDLSRHKGEGDEGFARLNMPLELGIAIARWYMTRESEHRHDWLLLVPPGGHHHRFISDLSGFDPADHDGTVEILVPKVVPWLLSRQHTPPLVTPRQVLRAFPRFCRRREELGLDWGDEIPWTQIVGVAREIAREL